MLPPRSGLTASRHERFNPHPARGRVLLLMLIDDVVVQGVSILTRPGGRVLRAAQQGRSDTGETVSILTRPGGRVLLIGWS